MRPHPHTLEPAPEARSESRPLDPSSSQPRASATRDPTAKQERPSSFRVARPDGSHPWAPGGGTRTLSRQAGTAGAKKAASALVWDDEDTTAHYVREGDDAPNPDQGALPIGRMRHVESDAPRLPAGPSSHRQRGALGQEESTSTALMPPIDLEALLRLAREQEGASPLLTCSSEPLAEAGQPELSTEQITFHELEEFRRLLAQEATPHVPSSSIRPKPEDAAVSPSAGLPDRNAPANATKAALSPSPGPGRDAPANTTKAALAALSEEPDTVRAAEKPSIGKRLRSWLPWSSS